MPDDASAASVMRHLCGECDEASSDPLDYVGIYWPTVTSALITSCMREAMRKIEEAEDFVLMEAGR